MVTEPTVEQTVAILKGIRHHYEDYHKLIINDDALQTAASMAARYISDRFLPDKAIDIMDEASSRVRIKKGVVPISIAEAQKALENLRRDKDNAIASQQYEMAAELRDREVQLQNKVKSMEQEWQDTKKKETPVVTEEDIAEVVSMWTGIPKDSLTTDPWHIGLLSAIPWGLAAVAMIFYGRHSDVTGERRWHVGIAGIVGALAFAASSLPGISGTAAFIALTVAAITVMCGHATFWALPTSMLSGTAAAAGIAWVNSMGNVAGYVSSYVVGAIRDATGSMTLALMALSFACLMSGVLVLVVGRPKRP